MGARFLDLNNRFNAKLATYKIADTTEDAIGALERLEQLNELMILALKAGA